MKKIKFQLPLSFVAITLALSGCSLANSMKKMEENTTDMNGTTKDMDANLVKVSGTMDSMNTDMGELKADMKAMKADVSSRLATTMEKMDERMGEMNTKLSETHHVMETKLATTMDVMAKALSDEMVPTMRELKNQIGSLQSLIQVSLGKTNDSIDKLSESIDGKMMAKMDALDGTVKKLNSIIETQLVKLMSDMNSTMSKDLLGSMQEMAAEVQSLGKDMKAMRGSVGGMNKKMNALPSMNEKMGALAKMDKKMDALSSMNAKMGALAKMDKKMDALPRMNSKLSKMNSKMDSLPEMNTTLKDVGKAMKSLPEMKDSIDRVDRKMGTLLDELKSMNKVLKTLGDLIPALREALAYFVRDRGYSNLERPTKIIEKFADAGVFLFAFEFQLKQPEDTAEYRALLHVFMNEFTRKIRGLIADENNMHVDPMLADNNHKTLQAIAACLQEESPDQIRMAEACMDRKKTDPTAQCYDKTTTVYDVLKLAIKHFNDDPDKRFFFQDDPSTGKLHKSHKESKLQMQTIMYLMQLRYNFLAALAAGQFFRAEESKSLLWSETLGEWKAIVGVWFDSKFELNEERLAHLNEESFNFINTALGYALETRAVIQEAGYTPVVDWKLPRVFGNIEFADLKTFDQSTPAKKRRIDRLKKTIALVNQIKAGYTKDRVSKGVVSDSFGVK